jgi:hypothetical protein
VGADADCTPGHNLFESGLRADRSEAGGGSGKEEAKAAKYPEPEQVDTDWTWQVLQQATKVSCMVKEI